MYNNNNSYFRPNGPVGPVARPPPPPPNGTYYMPQYAQLQQQQGTSYNNSYVPPPYPPPQSLSQGYGSSSDTYTPQSQSQGKAAEAAGDYTAPDGPPPAHTR